MVTPKAVTASSHTVVSCAPCEADHSLSDADVGSSVSKLASLLQQRNEFDIAFSGTDPALTK